MEGRFLLFFAIAEKHFGENHFRRAELRERRLNQVQAHESGKQKPVRRYKVSQGNRKCYQESGEKPDAIFKSHFSSY
jgi:hypothetical protein